MKKLDTSAITNTVAMPVKSGTLDFLQQSYQEALTAIGNNLLGAQSMSNVAYILYGCVNTGTGLNYIISAGAIYYNGEVYLVDATTFTAAGGQTAVGNISITQYVTNADPVLFSDAISRNIHNIRKILFSSAVSGTGLVDFANLKQCGIGMKNDQQASLPASYTVLFDQDRAVFFTSATVDSTITFDFTNAVPGAVVRLKWTYGAGRVLTINQPAGSNVIRDSGNLSAVASANNLLYLVYLGVNESGNKEVSYTLKQY